MTSPLLVIVSEPISEWIAKGEVVDRYYNPGNVFGEVHLLLINDDRPDPGAVQRMVGDARLAIHNLPPEPRLFITSLGWRPVLLRRWAREAVELARRIRPALARCHGVHLNAFAAAEVKRALGVPYVISLHTNPDRDIRRHPKREGNPRSRLRAWGSIALERRAIGNADCVVCVYRFIEPYAREMGARRVETIYNVVSTKVVEKTDYRIEARPARLILPGQQMKSKDPTPVVESLPRLPDVHCTLVGDGPYHQRLVDTAETLGVTGRCRFIPSLPNDTLCRSLKAYDALISVNDHGGVSKVELEAALVGMPVITNEHPLELAPELLGEHCLTVAGDADSYAAAIAQLLEDQELRHRLGTGLRRAAKAADPRASEAAYADLYRQIARPQAV